MINKKVFALTLIASSVIAAGCSSDDDDDEMDSDTGSLVDMTTDAVATDAQSRDVNGDGVLDDADDYNMDGFIDQADVDAYAVDFPDGGEGGEGGEGMGPVMADLPDGTDYDPAALTPAATLNLAEVAAGVPSLSSLNGAVANCPDLVAALTNADARLTVFAPNDDAFAAEDVTAALAAPDADACAVIAGHVLMDTVATSADLTDAIGSSATTLAGTTVAIEQGEDGILTVGGAPVIGGDNFATNGVAHIIGAVILPMAEDGTEGGEGGEDGDGGEGGNVSTGGSIQGGVQSAGDLSEFDTLFTETFGATTYEERNDGASWTIFAPTNDSLDDATIAGADADTRLGLLRDHVISSGKLSRDDIAANATIVTNLGTTYAVSDDGTTLTIDGEEVGEVVAEDDSTIVYRLNGVLGSSID